MYVGGESSGTGASCSGTAAQEPATATTEIQEHELGKYRKATIVIYLSLNLNSSLHLLFSAAFNCVFLRILNSVN